MICDTIRKGDQCVFMSASGCSYTHGSCHEVISDCEGCGRTRQYPTGWYCTASADPGNKWKGGHCNLATHIQLQRTTQRQKLNPLKASKRASN